MGETKEKSGYLGKVIFLLLLFMLFLLLPSVLYFRGGSYLNVDTLFDKFGLEKSSGYTGLYHKMGELMPWVIVCLTALIVIIINTIYYYLTFNEELLEERFNASKGWFRGINVLFVVCVIITVVYIVIFWQRKTDLEEILTKAQELTTTDKAKMAEVNSERIDKAIHLFNSFILDVELYTVFIITGFIAIDTISRIVKMKQLKAIGEALKSNGENQSLSLTYNRLYFAKEFISNQLWLIDIPVLAGIGLITIFKSQISSTVGNDPDARYIFVAGGIGMHIVMSQVIFIILYIRYKYKEHRIDTGKDKVGSTLLVVTEAKAVKQGA